jgi:hypothetical protein
MFNVPHSKAEVEKQLKRFQPLNYNRFFWWRRFGYKTPLHPYQPLLDRIQNGDFEGGCYMWQAYYSEILCNEAHAKWMGDWHRVNEECRMERARRKRLWDDHEKDETTKLKALQKAFLVAFKMDKEDYIRESESFDGSTEDFYYHCEMRYGKYNRTSTMPRRGRPRKVTNV